MGRTPYGHCAGRVCRRSHCYFFAQVTHAELPINAEALIPVREIRDPGIRRTGCARDPLGIFCTLRIICVRCAVLPKLRGVERNLEKYVVVDE